MSDMVPEVLNAALGFALYTERTRRAGIPGRGRTAVLPELSYSGAVQGKALGQRQDCSLPLQMPAGSDGGKETPG